MNKELTVFVEVPMDKQLFSTYNGKDINWLNLFQKLYNKSRASNVRTELEHCINILKLAQSNSAEFVNVYKDSYMKRIVLFFSFKTLEDTDNFTQHCFNYMWK
ncbi:MAG: hypothetical protein IJ220_08665 [Clostridia bacterium]|nr:hypothetical protein [Clostridia bacterium]